MLEERTDLVNNNNLNDTLTHIHHNSSQAEEDAIAVAYQVVRDHLYQQQQKLDILEFRLKRIVEITVARYQSQNDRGTIISIRKYYKHRHEYECQRWMVSSLRRLIEDIQMQDVSVNVYEKELQQIYHHHHHHRSITDADTTLLPLLNDDDSAMLDEIMNGCMFGNKVNDYSGHHLS
jgi:hypothetical protein